MDDEGIKAVDMKCIRHILGVSLKTNEWVLETTGVERELFSMMKRMKLSYFGHMMRKERNFLDKRDHGWHGTGSEKARETNDGLTKGKWTDMSFDKLLRETRHSGRWSRLVHERPDLGAKMFKDKTRLVSCANSEPDY